MGWRNPDRVFIEIDKSGPLYGLLTAGVNTVNNFATQIGSGLQAIALALSTPQDNSTEVQAQIDKTRQLLKSQVDALESAVKTQQPK